MALYESFRNVILSLGMSELTHPIFYNSTIGLRFNIGENGNEVYIHKSNDNFLPNPHYVTACLERSLKIYHSLRTTPDLLIIDGYLSENETIDDFISSVVTATDLPQPNEIKSEITQDDEGGLLHVFLLWSLKDFNPEKILKEIIKADLGCGNHFLTSSVYFVCTNDNVLFHLYDDRGADLVADKKEKIQHIYAKLNNLILDYDREHIDAILKATAQ